MKTTKAIMKPGSAIAWMENRKSRTQRVIKPQPEEGMKWGGTIMESTSKKVKRGDCFFYTGDLPLVEKEMHIRCPYGRPGDRLQLLTQWAVPLGFDACKPSDLLGSKLSAGDIWTAFDGPKPDWCGKTWSPIYMPGWLREAMPHPEILSIEARRLQEITEAEAMEEGITRREFVRRDGTTRAGYKHDWSELGQLSRFAGGIFTRNDKRPLMEEDICLGSARMAYANLWDSINAKRGYPWESNPWVWNIKFQERHR